VKNTVEITLLLLFGATVNPVAESGPHDAAAVLKIKETDATIAVARGETTVVVYNKLSPVVPDGIDPVYHRSGFLHPVSSPSGRVVTAVFPPDHLHQNGVFSAWVNTTWNGRKIDFWNLPGKTGRVLHHKVISVFCDGDVAGFEVDLIHRIVEPPVIDVLMERWKVTVRAIDDSYHCIDLETRQTALTDLPLTINQHHYGGIALRGPGTWREPQDNSSETTGDEEAETHESPVFLNDSGSDRIQGNLQKSQWVSMTGPLDGRAVSIAVLGHPGNFRAPQAARLHPTMPYFCYAPCIEGPFVIDLEHPFHARYRYLITDTPPETKWLNQQWQDWNGE